MRKKNTLYRLTLGLLIGALIMPAQPAQAQFGVGGFVFDVKNYTVNMKKYLQDVVHYAELFNTAVGQYTTLQGMLGQFEEVVANQRDMLRTMADIRETVRAVYDIKELAHSLITTRLDSLKRIDDRLRNGIFDPEADLRDLENYILNSMGRRAQYSEANLERLRKMDNTLERIEWEMKKVQADLLVEQEKEKKLRAAIDKTPRDQISNSVLQTLLASCLQLIDQLTQRACELEKRKQERVEKYFGVMEERVKFGDQVDEMDNAWKKFGSKVEQILKNIDDPPPLPAREEQ